MAFKEIKCYLTEFEIGGGIQNVYCGCTGEGDGFRYRCGRCGNYGRSACFDHADDVTFVDGTGRYHLIEN